MHRAQYEKPCCFNVEILRPAASVLERWCGRVAHLPARLNMVASVCCALLRHPMRLLGWLLVFFRLSPVFGFHLIIAIVLAYFLAGNIAAAALGTTLANPITLPFIWGSTYELGRFVISGDIESAPTIASRPCIASDEVW